MFLHAFARQIVRSFILPLRNTHKESHFLFVEKVGDFPNHVHSTNTPTETLATCRTIQKEKSLMDFFSLYAYCLCGLLERKKETARRCAVTLQVLVYAKDSCKERCQEKRKEVLCENTKSIGKHTHRTAAPRKPKKHIREKENL